MARKRSSSNKKTKSRKGSANPSSSTTPATTPASASFPESIVAAEAAAENAPTTTGSASRAAEQTHVDAEKIDSVDEVLEKPAESENKTSTDEQRSAKIDDSTYKLHISLASEAEEQITEDQLDEQYLRVSANNDNEKNPATSLASAVGRPQMPSIAIEGDESFVLATQIATNDEEADLGILEEHTEDSVNMEDSQAEILSSNIYNSMYRSAATNEKVSADEVHVLESSGVSEAANNAHNDDLDDEEDLEYISTDKAEEEEPSDNSVLRSYVITPSAFADEKEPDVVTHIRAASAASKQVSDLQEDNEPSAAESDGDIASSVTPDVDTRLYTSIADSFIHVSASNDGIDKRDVEAKVASVAGNAADRDDVSLEKREAAQQIEDKVVDTMGNAKDNAKKVADQADKAASDAKRDVDNAADKASKRTKEAADDASDAAHDASVKAKDMLDNASKSVKDAASNANDKAQDALHRARESGEKLAKKAREEANEAEKAVRRQANETSPTTLRVLGIVAAALAMVAGYHFRLPGRENQRIGFAGGVASAIIGLGTLATAFIRRNSN